MSVPSRLYKYESWSTRALQNLKSQAIYFGSPLNFNDPYDCAIAPNIESPDDTEVERVRTYLLTDKRTGPSVPARLASMPASELREILVKLARVALRQNIDSFLALRGVACFSEQNDNLLMWSHYGGRYRGFCLEFKTSDPAFEKARQVRYSELLPTARVSNILVAKNFDLVADLFATKAAPWAYEKEWRALHEKVGTEYCYKPNSLTGVYFGPDMDAQSMEIVCLILSGQNEHVKFWKGKRSETEFRVDFEKFTYTSYLEAKRLGFI
jgi:Protein of unknown function (DUF2971)